MYILFLFLSHSPGTFLDSVIARVTSSAVVGIDPFHSKYFFVLIFTKLGTFSVIANRFLVVVPAQVRHGETSRLRPSPEKRRDAIRRRPVPRLERHPPESRDKPPSPPRPCFYSSAGIWDRARYGSGRRQTWRDTDAAVRASEATKTGGQRRERPEGSAVDGGRPEPGGRRPLGRCPRISVFHSRSVYLPGRHVLSLFCVSGRSVVRSYGKAGRYRTSDGDTPTRASPS